MISTLASVQLLLLRAPSNALQAKENLIKDELDRVFDQEELLWIQKSREQWLTLGDHNTAFYHASTIDGIWVDDKLAVEELAITFYKNLYLDDGSAYGCYGRVFQHSPTDAPTALIRLVSNSKIWGAVKVMSALKAHGVDIYQPIFFQESWHVVSESRGLRRGVLQVICKGARWILESRGSFRFRLDPWLLVSPLSEWAIENIEHCKHLLVRQYWCNESGWDALSDLLPSRLILKLASTPLHPEEGVDDELSWSLTADGKFKVKSGSELISGMATTFFIGKPLYDTIWNLSTIEWVCTFTWFLKGECSAIRNELGDILPPQLCAHPATWMMRALSTCLGWHCPRVKTTWQSWQPTTINPLLLSSSFSLCLHSNLLSDRVIAGELRWNVIFATYLWWTWKWRNMRVFQEEMDWK
ncbi:LOW QUALITY PROTEIN: hypothetical protein V2J09_023578 [Rumex salicifolius]